MCKDFGTFKAQVELSDPCGSFTTQGIRLTRSLCSDEINSESMDKSHSVGREAQM